MNFIRNFYQFMAGRYGIDELYYFFIFLYFLISIFNLFFRLPILFIMETLLFVFLTYRVFSKNILKRQKENQIYLKGKGKFLSFFENKKRNWQDRNDFIYKKCRKCKTTLRIPLPNERGIKYLTCPKCKRRWKVYCFRREKVEITRANGKKFYR